MFSRIRSTRRFNWPFAIFLIILCVTLLGVGLWYVIGRPSFGGWFDCAWNWDTKSVTDCRTPGVSWWGPAGLSVILIALFLLFFLGFLFIARRSRSSLVDVLTVAVSSIIGVLTAGLACFFCLKICFCYPSRFVGGNSEECNIDPQFPVAKACCWMYGIWMLPLTIFALMGVRWGSRSNWPSCCICCPHQFDADDEEVSAPKGFQQCWELHGGFLSQILRTSTTRLVQNKNLRRLNSKSRSSCLEKLQKNINIKIKNYFHTKSGLSLQTYTLKCVTGICRVLFFFWKSWKSYEKNSTRIVFVIPAKCGRWWWNSRCKFWSITVVFLQVREPIGTAGGKRIGISVRSWWRILYTSVSVARNPLRQFSYIILLLL